MKLNGLEKQFKTDKLIGGEIIDFRQTINNNVFLNMDQQSLTPLMYALQSNKRGNLNLSSEQWDYLIKNSDLQQVNLTNMSAIMFALKKSVSENLGLTEGHWTYLIHNSNLKQVSETSPLILALKLNKQHKTLNTEQVNYLIQHSDLNNPHLLSYIFSQFIEKNNKYDLSELQYQYIIENSDFNVYINQKPLIKLLLEDHLFLNEIGEKNKTYLISKFPEFIEDKKEFNLEDKFISLEAEVKDLKSIIYNLAATNKLILEKLNTKNTNKKII